MEKVLVTMIDGSKHTVEFKNPEFTFDEFVRLNDESQVVKAANGYRLPIRSILFYKIEDVTQNG